MRNGALVPNQVIPLLLDEAPKREEIRRGRVPVEQHEARTDCEAGDEVVPHHPTGSGEPEKPVLFSDVGHEAERLAVLEKDPSVGMDDRLRQACCSRRVEDVQRMIERDLLELERTQLLRDQVAPGDRPG